MFPVELSKRIIPACVLRPMACCVLCLETMWGDKHPTNQGQAGAELCSVSVFWIMCLCSVSVFWIMCLCSVSVFLRARANRLYLETV